MVATVLPLVSSLAPQSSAAARIGEPAPERHHDAELLDESAGFLGMGRSLTFPFAQWRAHDEHRTVYFDEGRGDPVVFVHGLGANATHWELVACELVRRYRVVGLDLVGCGWSRKPDVSYRLELLRDHLLDFLDRRGIGNATLVGHSMGGAVCLAAALERPGQFESLVLVGATGLTPLPRWMRLPAPLLLRRRLLRPVLERGANFILNNVFVDREQDNPHVDWFKRSAMRDDPGHPNLRDFARVCESLCRDLARRDYTDQLPNLHLPVLALWGDSDKLTPVSSVLRQIGRIRHVRTVIVPRCGHMPMVERPAQTVFHLERFLESPP